MSPPTERPSPHCAAKQFFSWREKVRMRASALSQLHAREEVFEKPVVNSTSLGMILHAEHERIIAQLYLLDDPILCAPRFYFQPLSQFLDRLMVRDVHFFIAVTHAAFPTHRLHIFRFLERKIMPADVEL